MRWVVDAKQDRRKRGHRISGNYAGELSVAAVDDHLTEYLVFYNTVRLTATCAWQHPWNTLPSRPLNDQSQMS